SLNVETRIAAAQNLIVSFHSLLSTGSPDNETVSTELVYSLKRLFRGLSSVRNAARQGFSLALSELLHLLHTHDIPSSPTLPSSPTSLLSLFKEVNVQNTVSSSDKDKKDSKIATIFAIQAFINSGIFINKEYCKKDLKINECLIDVVDLLWDAAMFKQYLMESSMSCVILLIYQ
ncbi:hypothetical protein HK096_001645, partial [Nowakowskiella sp. JEL0078]